MHGVRLHQLRANLPTTLVALKGVHDVSKNKQQVSS